MINNEEINHTMESSLFFRIQPLILIHVLLAFTFIIMTGFYQRSELHRENFSQDGLISDNVSLQRGRQHKVEIYDQYLQMSIGSYMVPDEWTVKQDIALDPNSGNFKKFTLEFTGHQGELIRMFNSTPYYQKEDKIKVWGDTTSHYLQNALDQLIIDDFKPSERMQRSKIAQEQIKLAHDQGMALTYWEASISGHHNGLPYQGSVLISDLTYAVAPEMGVLGFSFAICPEDQFSQIMQTIEEIDSSYQKNPKYEQCRIQIQNYLAQLSYRYHDDFYRDEKTGEFRRMSERRKMWSAPMDSTCACSYFKPVNNSYDTPYYSPSEDTTSWWSPIEYTKE